MDGARRELDAARDAEDELRSAMQKERGEKKIAACIADQLIIDTPSLISRLPPGSYEAVLLKRAPIPPQARRHLVVLHD